MGEGEEGGRSVTITHPQKATSSWQCERYFRLHPYGYPRDGTRLSIHKREKGFDWKMAGGSGSESGAFAPSDDLATLLVLMIGQLVPVGIVADRLQEDHPDLEKVAVFLRLWENHDRYAKAIAPLMKQQEAGDVGTMGHDKESL
jgi:hypothetical protein